MNLRINHRPAHLVLVVALPSEAKPFIEAWRLKLVRDRNGSRLFTNENDTVTLVQCGVGRTAAALGVATTFFHRNECTSMAWLNVGIAGAADHRLGTSLIAQKIVDRGTEKKWYPPQIAKRPSGLQGTTIVTVDRGESNYQRGEAYDMEASAFVEAATRFSCAEVVQCIKVVSDNPGRHLEKITKEHVSQLLSDALPIISEYTTNLRTVADLLTVQNTPSPHLDSVLNIAHFTTTQKHQLSKVLKRWQALKPDADPTTGIVALRDAKTIIAHLANTLDQEPIAFGALS